jgi:hypothetical protein
LDEVTRADIIFTESDGHRSSYNID